MSRKKWFTKKKLSATVAVISAATLLLSGTLAFVNENQHKTNEASGSGTKYDATLVENFEEVNDWKTSDAAVTKEISVKNTGATDGTYGDVYVRLQLKEYMETGAIGTIETAERYMIDTNGAFLIFDTASAAQAAYPDHTVTKLTDAVSGKTGFFVQTQAEDPNGQYGRYVVTKFTVGDAVSLIDGVERASEEAETNHSAGSNGECEYTVHKWDSIVGDGTDTATFLAYVSWILGDDVISIEDWDGEPVAAWIIDTTSEQGWVYWGQPLAPGEETSNLLEKIALILQPEGSFYYAIHAELEAISWDQIGNWNDAPQSIVDMVNNTGNGTNPGGNESLKDDLSDLLDKAKDILENDEDKYTPGSWEESDLGNVIKDAEDVLNNPDATEEDYQNAIDDLNDALDKLVEKDNPLKGELSDLLDKAKDIFENDEDQYTPGSWADSDLENVIKDAEDVLNNPDATDEDYQNAIDDLNDALDKLVEKEDNPLKDELSDLLEKAKDILENDEDQYTPESWEDSDLGNVIKDAEDVLNNPDATDEDYQKAIDDLNDALDKLVEKLELKAPYDTDPTYTPSALSQNDRISLDYGSPWDAPEDRVFTYTTYPEWFVTIALADILEDTSDLASVELTILGDRWTTAEVYIDRATNTIISKGIPTYQEIIDGGIHVGGAFDNTLDAVVPAVITLTQNGKSVTFTINNMYYGLFTASYEW